MRVTSVLYILRILSKNMCNFEKHFTETDKWTSIKKITSKIVVDRALKFVC